LSAMAMEFVFLVELTEEIAEYQKEHILVG